MEEIEREYKFKNHKEWFEKLQEAPNPGWCKKRKLGDNKSTEYLPIYYQQALADLFFRELEVFENNFQLINNEILCTVKIKFLPDFPDSEYRIISGVAAKAIQQRTGNFASTYPEGKITNAVEYNAPAARSAAISNALATFANIFGRNLGRESAPNFSFKREDQQKKEYKK